MFKLFKKHAKNENQKSKDKVDEDCEMCHIPDEVVEQLKKDADKKPDHACCK